MMVVAESIGIHDETAKNSKQHVSLGTVFIGCWPRQSRLGHCGKRVAFHFSLYRPIIYLGQFQVLVR